MFIYKTQIFLHHTDAAGRLFFTNQFYFMHEAMEKLLESLGMSLEEILNEKVEVTFPLVHAETDYKAILVSGDRIAIEIGVEKLGKTSVHFTYNIRKADNTLAGTGKTVNVCVDKATGQKTDLPQEWRERLKKALIK